MKFLKLSTIDADGNRSAYDLLNDRDSLSLEETLSFIEDALFGNDALFGGSTELTVDFDGEEYAIKRDFSSAQDVRVITSGKTLPGEKAEEIINGIAGLSDKKWKLNSAPVDTDEFIADPSQYTERFLSSLGYDSEELEKISEEKENLRKITAAQAEALKEVVAPIDQNEQAEAEKNFLKAEKNLETVISLRAEHSAGIARAERKKAAEKELEELKLSEEKINEMSAVLDEDARLRANIAAYEAINKMDAETETVKTDLNALTAEIENDSQENKRLSEEIDKKVADLSEHTEKIKSLAEEFARLITENSEKGELTAAALEKATDGTFLKLEEELAAFEEWNTKYLEISGKLAGSRLNYEKRSFVRQGMALETSLSEKRDRFETVKKLAENQKDFLAELEAELADSQSLYGADDRDRIAKADEKRMKLLKYKILCHSLQVDISAAEQKIRANKEAKQSYAEDITALTRAKNAINDYVAKCEARNAKLGDKLISLKARLSFCKDVDELEYGALCPICNGRITDKIELSKENARLSASYEKYSAELMNNRSILAEYSSKLEKIDTRLGQLHERDNLCNSYLESLNVMVSAKQTALTGILREAEANSVPALEKMFDSADKEFTRMSDAGVDGAFLRDHIEYVTKEIDRIKANAEALSEEAETLEHELAETEDVYNTEIASGLEGRSAYDMIDDVMNGEKAEDALFEELVEAEKNRAQHLAFIISTEKSAPEFVNAAAEIMSDVVEELRQTESLRKQSDEERKALVEAVTEISARLEEKTELKNRLSEIIANNSEAKTELLKTASVEGINDDTLEELKSKLLSDEEKNTVTEEIESYRNSVATLTAEIDDLNVGSCEIDLDKLQSLDEAKDAFKNAHNAFVAAQERKAMHDATESFANAKLLECVDLAAQAHSLKKIAGGEATDVILPVINDALRMTGPDMIAVNNGAGLTFTKDNGKPISEINSDSLTVAVNSALNYALRLASGSETVKFARVDKPQNVTDAAEKYGVILI